MDRGLILKFKKGQPNKFPHEDIAMNKSPDMLIGIQVWPPTPPPPVVVAAKSLRKMEK